MPKDEKNMPGGKMAEPPEGQRPQKEMPHGEMHEPAEEKPAPKRRATAKKGGSK